MHLFVMEFNKNFFPVNFLNGIKKKKDGHSWLDFPNECSRYDTKQSDG